jgi:hypothetical protein
MVWTEVCASFRNSERVVMFIKCTGTFICFVTLCAITKSLRSVPTSNGMDVFKTGVVSFAHFIPSGLFQSSLLLQFAYTMINPINVILKVVVPKVHSFKRNMIVKNYIVVNQPQIKRTPRSLSCLEVKDPRYQPPRLT